MSQTVKEERLGCMRRMNNRMGMGVIVGATSCAAYFITSQDGFLLIGGAVVVIGAMLGLVGGLQAAPVFMEEKR